MKVIGLTGSIAAGKSAVAAMMREEGLAVFDSDAAVHELYRDSRFAAELERALGPVTTEKTVDRALLVQRLLEDPSLLAKLESLVHPRVRSMREVFVDERRAAGDDLVILDIPLLFETGAETDVDAVLVVAAPEHIRRARAFARPGMTVEKWNAINARQWPQEKKVAAATIVIDNDGALQDLREKVRSAIAALKTMKGSRHA